MPTPYEARYGTIKDRILEDPGLPAKNPTVAYWQVPANESIPQRQSSQLVDEVDVIVIGSGITGCSAAKALLENNASIRVTVLEARSVTSGATGRNGGHIKAVPERTYAELLPILGREQAREVVDFTLANVQALLDVSSTLSKDLQQRSEVRKVESINLFTDEGALSRFADAVKIFDNDNAELKGRGRFVNEDELKCKYGASNAVGAYVSSAGAAWPYRLITGIFSDLLEKHSARFSLESQTPVHGVEASEDGTYRVQTSRGPIRAKHVVHATNGHAGHLLPALRGPLFPIRGQMSAQEPTSTFGVQGSDRSWSIHYDNGYDYITQSGQSGEIFIGGGLARSVGRGIGELGNVHDDLNSVNSVAHLGGALNAVFGIEHGKAAASRIKAVWTGVMGFTSDGLPLVGRMPQETTGRRGQGEWIAAGFNGYGMANAWLCGKHVAECILDTKQPEPLPQAYHISTERLQNMSADIAAKSWLSYLGLD